MIDLVTNFRCKTDRATRRGRMVACVLLASALGGCATGGVQSSVFVDPSRFDLYDCPQLYTARAVADKRAVELEVLIAKAQTGVAGSIVSGLAYQADYQTAVARRDLIDQKLASNNCRADQAPAPVAVDDPASRSRQRR